MSIDWVRLIDLFGSLALLIAVISFVMIRLVQVLLRPKTLLYTSQNLYSTGIKNAQRIYSDNGNAYALINKKYGFSGKPDEIWKTQSGKYYPVEYKPFAKRLYNSTRIQLISYCALVEEHYGRCDGGIFVGADRQGLFIPYDSSSRKELLNVIAEMGTGCLDAEPQLSIKCDRCGYNLDCFPEAYRMKNAA